MDAAEAISKRVFWLAGFALTPDVGTVALEALKEAGFAVIPKDRIERLTATAQVNKVLLHSAVTDITKYITRDLGKQIGTVLVEDAGIVTQGDVTDYETLVEFKAVVDVILPEPKE